MIAFPVGSEGVKAYRFNQAKLGQVTYDGEPGKPFIQWLEKCESISGLWTNGYTKDFQATAAVMRSIDVPVTVDVDDLFDEVPKGNTALVGWFHRRKLEYRAMLENADRRVASTPFLAERYGCEVAPNFLDAEAWDWPRRPRDDDWTVLLHCGSVNRAQDYLEQEAAFRAFLDMPKTKVVFMGWMPRWAKEYPPGRVVFCRWVEWEKYPRMMRWIVTGKQ